MAQIITVAQQKGGAGKTSLAAHLAVAWMQKPRRIALFDLDPQASLTTWHQQRQQTFGENNTLTLIETTPWRLGSEVARASREADIIVIDSPGVIDASAKAAIRASDLVVVPLQLSPMDVWASKNMVQLLQAENAGALLVLNRVPYRARLADELIIELKKGPTPIARSALGNRIAFAASLMEGKGITEWAPHSVGAAEIRLLADEILRRAPQHGARKAA
ncbi:MAG TPA: cobyrinic acid a,c-diamide synthase [Alphaproteobacteria bacterium]|nr:cobyrinic acid a,c-diamide synthase [Alphaproteobacteria bacterium]